MERWRDGEMERWRALNMSFHVFSCLFMSSLVFSCLLMSSHVFSCLLVSLIDEYLRKNEFPADLIQSAYYFIRSVQHIWRFREIDMPSLHADYLAKLAACEHTQNMNDILTNGTAADRVKITTITELPACPRPPTTSGGALIVVPNFVTHALIEEWAGKTLMITQVFAEADEEHGPGLAPVARATTTAASKKRKAAAAAPRTSVCRMQSICDWMSTLPAKLVLAAGEVEREKSYIADGDVLLAALNDQARLAHATTDVQEIQKCFQDALAAFRAKGQANVKNARAGLVRICKDIDTNLTELEEMQAGDAFTKDDVQDSMRKAHRMQAIEQGMKMSAQAPVERAGSGKRRK